MAGATTEDDWLDEQLLADDPKSERMWKRDAIGMNKPEAMKGLPRTAQITVKVPIVMWRVYRQHLNASGMTMGAFLRQAIGEKMLRDGVPASEIEGWFK